MQNYLFLCNQTTIKHISGREEANILTHLILWDSRIPSQGPPIIEDQIESESVSAAVMFLKRPSLPMMTLYMYCSPRAQSVQIYKRKRKTSKLHHLIRSEQITDHTDLKNLYCNVKKANGSMETYNQQVYDAIQGFFFSSVMRLV